MPGRSIGRASALAGLLLAGVAAGAAAATDAGVVAPIAIAPDGVVTSDRCQPVKQAIAVAVQAQLVPLRQDTEKHLPEFAEWMFDWNASYTRERALLSASFATAYEEVSAGRLTSLPDAVGDRLRQEVSTSFRRIVLEPERIDARSGDAWVDLVEQADRLRDDVGADSEEAAGLPPPAGAGEMTTPEYAINEGLTRTPLPIVTRLAGVAVRRAAGLSVFGVARIAAEQLETALAFIPGLILGYGGAVATALGIDYAVTTIDATLHRPSFEADLVQGTRKIYAEIGDEWTRRLTARIDQRCGGNS